MLANRAFVLREIYGKYILMPVWNNDASNNPILLNEVGSFIWKTAEKPVDYESILESVAEEYGLREGSPEMISVGQFVSQMLDMKLLLRFSEEE